MRFSVNDSTTQGILIDANNNVGIDTAAPAHKLDVIGGEALSGNLYVTNDTYHMGASSFGVQTNFTFLVNGGYLQCWKTTNGVTNGLVWQINQTNAAASFFGNVTFASEIQVGNGSFSSPALNFGGSADGIYYGSTHIIFKRNTATLAVADQKVTQHSGSLFGWSATSSPNNNNDTSIYRQSAGTIGTTNIYASGNVGIGTTAPAQKLDVNGNASFAGFTVYKSNTVTAAQCAAAITNGDFGRVVISNGLYSFWMSNNVMNWKLAAP